MEIISHKGLNFQKLYSQEKIEKIISNIAEGVNSYYDSIKAEEGSLELVAVCLLKGGFMFFSDLVKKIKHPHYTEFLKVSSYKGTSSTGKITLTEDPKPEWFSGRHVLIVEDMHDTGNTLKSIVSLIEEFKPKKIDIAVLVVRPDKPRQVDIKWTGL